MPGNKQESLTILQSSASLQKVEDIAGFNKFFHDRAKEVKNTVTPKEHIESKGGYPFASYGYMLEQMDILHPLRAETFALPPTFLLEPLCFMTAIEVKDLVTGETRCGVGLHPVPAYDKESRDPKPMKVVRELLANSAKASLTQAQRHAYSNFGICADLYESNLDEITEAQERDFETFSEKVKEVGGEKVLAWFEKVKEGWSTQRGTTAEEYMKDCWAKLNSVIESRKAKETK